MVKRLITTNLPLVICSVRSLVSSLRYLPAVVVAVVSSVGSLPLHKLLEAVASSAPQNRTAHLRQEACSALKTVLKQEQPQVASTGVSRKRMTNLQTQPQTWTLRNPSRSLLPQVLHHLRLSQRPPASLHLRTTLHSLRNRRRRLPRLVVAFSRSPPLLPVRLRANLNRPGSSSPSLLVVVTSRPPASQKEQQVPRNLCFRALVAPRSLRHLQPQPRPLLLLRLLEAFST